MHSDFTSESLKKLYKSYSIQIYKHINNIRNQQNVSVFILNFVEWKSNPQKQLNNILREYLSINNHYPYLSKKSKHQNKEESFQIIEKNIILKDCGYTGFN
eukprot:98048_1